MLRYFAIFGSSASLIYFLWNISTQSMRVSFGWAPDWNVLFLQLLYWPAALIAWGSAISGGIILTQRKISIGAAVIVAAAPMIAYSLYLPGFSIMKGYNHRSEMQHGWFQESQRLNALFIHYYFEHADKIQWTGSDDTVDATPFIEELSKKRTFEKAPYGITITGNKAFTSWGSPIVFAVDRSGDGYIDVLSRRRSLNYYADPWNYDGWSYKVGVGCTPQNIPTFFDKSAIHVTTLADYEYLRQQESLKPKIQ